MPRVLVPLAHGFEEIEAVTVIDVLRRANVEVVVAALASDMVEGSHGLRVAADRSLDTKEMYELRARMFHVVHRSGPRF